MGERDPTELLLERVRRIGPPPGAAERVLTAVEARRGGRRVGPASLRVALPVTGLVAVAAALVALTVPHRHGASSTSPASAVVGWAVAGDGSAPSTGGTVVVGSGRRATLVGPGGRVRLDGPARARWKGDRLALEDGTGRVTGRATLEGAGGCRVCVDGTADVAVETEVLAVTILAGTVAVEEGRSSCRVVEVEDALAASPMAGQPPADRSSPRREPSGTGRPSAAVSGGRTPEAAAEATVGSRGPLSRASEGERALPGAAGRSELAHQLGAYRDAMALRGVDDARALAAWRRFARRWPTSPMLHEVLLNEVDALERLGRRTDARRAAQRFLRRFPDSPRAEELRRIAGSAPGEDPETP